MTAQINYVLSDNTVVNQYDTGYVADWNRHLTGGMLGDVVQIQFIGDTNGASGVRAHIDNVYVVIAGNAMSPVGGGSIIMDGDMEYPSSSSPWSLTYTDGRYSNGRKFNSNPVDFLTYGFARCGTGYQIIGDYQSFIVLGQDAGYSDIGQTFSLNGGGVVVIVNTRLPVTAEMVGSAIYHISYW